MLLTATAFLALAGFSVNSKSKGEATKGEGVVVVVVAGNRPGPVNGRFKFKWSRGSIKIYFSFSKILYKIVLLTFCQRSLLIGGCGCGGHFYCFYNTLSSFKRDSFRVSGLLSGDSSL
jgi:hypothetical protein